MHQFISTYRPGLRNVLVVILKNDLLRFSCIIQNIRNFREKNPMLNHNRNIGQNNRNLVISPNRPALLLAVP